MYLPTKYEQKKIYLFKIIIYLIQVISLRSGEIVMDFNSFGLLKNVGTTMFTQSYLHLSKHITRL